jgi:hypothetical protein
MTDHDLDVLMTQREAAAMVRLSERTLERYRTSGRGPRYIALGRAVRYRRRDLLDFVERCVRNSTSEGGGAVTAAGQPAIPKRGGAGRSAPRPAKQGCGNAAR